MRYPASEKLEIIRIVEQSHLPAKRTLDQLGIARVKQHIVGIVGVLDHPVGQVGAQRGAVVVRGARNEPGQQGEHHHP